MRAPGPMLTPAQAEAFAAGLYHLAAIDGVTPAERTEITDLLTAVGQPALAERIDGLGFDPITAFEALETRWLRGVFLQAAVRVIRADHAITDAEREALSWLAEVFEVDGGYPGVLARVDGSQPTEAR